MTRAPLITKPNIEDVFDAFATFHTRSITINTQYWHFPTRWNKEMQIERDKLRAKLVGWGFADMIDWERRE